MDTIQNTDHVWALEFLIDKIEELIMAYPHPDEPRIQISIESIESLVSQLKNLIIGVPDQYLLIFLNAMLAEAYMIQAYLLSYRKQNRARCDAAIESYVDSLRACFTGMGITNFAEIEAEYAQRDPRLDVKWVVNRPPATKLLAHHYCSHIEFADRLRTNNFDSSDSNLKIPKIWAYRLRRNSFVSIIKLMDQALEQNQIHLFDPPTHATTR